MIDMAADSAGAEQPGPNARLASGRTVWDELTYRYSRGVSTVRDMARTWDSLKSKVDAVRFHQTAALLRQQQEEAQWWRDACIAYFQSISKRPMPAGFAPPAHPLEYYQSLKFPYAPGRGG